MKTKFLTAVLILSGLLLTAEESYAWNQPPIANLVAFREYVILGRPAFLDGNDPCDYSYDPDGYITKYEWDFTDNGSYDYSETASSYPDGAFDGRTTYTYPCDTNCTYTAKLRVTDNESATDTNTCVIYVGPDSDGDGLPDAWEDLYQELDDANSADADEDSDSDGYNNLCEYLHGSEPNDDTSKPFRKVTIYVPADVNAVPSNAKAIQRAIDASIDGDTIIVSEGTYYEAIDFIGISCTLTSTDPYDWEVVANTIIDANDSDANVVTFSNSEDGNSMLTGFTITGGARGIYCEGASPEITNCVIIDNGSITYGAGVYCYNEASPMIKNCVISDNTATWYGGGMFNYYRACPTLINCVISDNTAIWCGGGMYNCDGACPTLINCVFSGNSAVGSLYDSGLGGGIANYYSSSPALMNCTFTGNSAENSWDAYGFGGGIYNSGYDGYYGSSPILINCIFWDNHADGSNTGDEIYNYDDISDPNFNNCDIRGGINGTYCDGYDSNDCGGNINSDPNFIDAGNPAGPDGIFGTYDDGLHLWIVSPCIDAADGNAASSSDLTGRSRIDVNYVDNTGTGDPNYADIGAYESITIWLVDKDATGSDDGSLWDDAFDELRDALTDNDVNDGDEIWVAEGTYKPDDVNDDWSVSFDLVEGVAVYGGFAGTEVGRYQRNWTVHKTILSGDIGTPDSSSDNSYHVVKGADNAILDGFLIRGGNADGSYPDNMGGGIYCYNTSPTITNCVIAGNSGAGGAGIFCYMSSPTISNCLFTDNTSTGGGGMYNYWYSNATLTNCTFSGNSAEAGYGGGMHNYNYSSPTVTNCIFWSDTAEEIVNWIGSNPGFSYCDIQGCGSSSGWDPNFGTDLGGNIDNDPCFVDVNNPAGPDGVFFSWDDGLRLDANSLCADAADGNAAPSADILRLGRVDIADINNTGIGEPNYTDIGAYESYSGYDSDGDGIDDDYEILHDLDPDSDDASEDLDGDGLTNLQEFGIRTMANNADTDGDGMDDYWEDYHGLDPLDAGDADDDSDGDGRNNLLEYQDGSDPFAYTEVSRIEYEYDNAGQITKEIIQDTVKNNVGVTEYKYDELGRKWQVRRWASAGGSSNVNDIITLQSYDVRSNAKKAVRKGVGGTDPNSIQTEYDLITENSYNSLGRLTDVNDNGLITEYTYYEGGQADEVNDPNGNITTSDYDGAGRLNKTVDAESHYRLNFYNSLGRLIKQVAYDSGSNALIQTRSEYDGLGHVIRRAVMADADSTSSISTSVDMVVDYNYTDSNGLLIYKRKYYYSGTAATTNYEYDGLGRRTRTTDPAGNQTILTYNVMGQVIQRQQIDVNPLAGEPNLVITTGYVYGSLGRLDQQTAKLDVSDSNTWQITTYYYNALGKRSLETRPNGVIVTYSYNALGQLTEKIADADGAGKIEQKTEYGYDRLGRQTSITGYADGSTAQTTTYTYNELGRITKVTYPDGNDIDFEYNPAGKVTKRTDQRGIVTEYSYNGTYNMLAKYVDGKTETDDANEIFTYDGLGRMLTATKEVDSNTIETEYVYNDIGKIADTNDKIFGGTERETRYTYDQAGFPYQTYYPGGLPLSQIIPDWQGRIDTLKAGITPIAKYKYIGSRVAQRNYRDIIYYEPTYDNLGRITSADSNATYAKFDYEYDPKTNNISRQIYDHRTSPDDDPCTDFSYDNLDRLSAAEYGIDDTNEAFTIDDLGNRKNVNVRDGNDVTYTVDDLTNRYTSVSEANLTYDAAGNLTKDKDSYEYKYDYENRIVKITKDGNDIAEFAYDALGRRVEKKDLIDPNNTRRYYYDYKWQVLCEYNGSGVFQRWFAYGNYIDEVLAMGTAPMPFSAMFYIHDHLYSPAALTNFWGTVLERYEYDAYGNCYVLEPNFAPDSDGESDYGNPYLFTGRRVDILDSGSLKIQYNRNRYYDYYTGRWLTHDLLGIVPNSQGANEYNPIGQYRDGLNIYEYVRSNPITNNDPLGLSLKSEAINKLEALGDEHDGYDYYTQLTGLQSLIDDKLIPALEWLDDDDYFVGGPKYKGFPQYNIYLPRDASGSTVFHEAIHVQNDISNFIDLSRRDDEGIATVAEAMAGYVRIFKYIEDSLEKDVLPIPTMQRSWANAWSCTNSIVPNEWIIYYWGGFVRKEVNATESDVSNVASELDFEIKCEKIAEHYNKIMKAHTGWKKARCPRFTCNTIPFVNVRSFHLNVELHSVFK